MPTSSDPVAPTGVAARIADESSRIVNTRMVDRLQTVEYDMEAITVAFREEVASLHRHVHKLSIVVKTLVDFISTSGLPLTPEIDQLLAHYMEDDLLGQEKDA